MNYETIKLDKSMYKGREGFSGKLEELDPSAAYKGTALEGLDAFQRQLRRFDIRVGGPRSSAIQKFFSTADSAKGMLASMTTSASRHLSSWTFGSVFFS